MWSFRFLKSDILFAEVEQKFWSFSVFKTSAIFRANVKGTAAGEQHHWEVMTGEDLGLNAFTTR